MKATQIRKGNIVRIDGTLYKIMNMDHVTPGKGRAHIQTKLRNLLEGTQTEKRFRSDEDIEKVMIETKGNAIPVQRRRRVPFHGHGDLRPGGNSPRTRWGTRCNT